MEIYFWFAATAIIFTFVGYVWGLKAQLINTVTATIDSLIKDGYLKTKGTGKDLIILKWNQWDNDKAN